MIKYTATPSKLTASPGEGSLSLELVMDPEPIFSELQVANQPGLGLGVGSLVIFLLVWSGMLMMMDDMLENPYVCLHTKFGDVIQWLNVFNGCFILDAQ